MKKKLIITTIILMLSISVFIFLSARNHIKEDAYEFTVVKRGDIENSVSCTGTLEAVSAVEVGTELSGTVSQVLVDFNDTVEKNQILAILDTTQLAINLKIAQADLIKAEAQYNLSKRNYQNNSDLYAKKFISELDLITSETTMKVNYVNLLSAQANLEKAELNINKYSIIRSPINGKILDRSIEEGQTVAASLSAPTLFYIAEDLRTMEIYASVDESDIGLVQVGMEAEFTVESYADEDFNGVVKQIRLQPETISNVVNYTVIIETTNELDLLLPGMTATIDLIIEKKSDVLLVSSSALKFMPDQNLLSEVFKKRNKENIQNRLGNDNKQISSKKRPDLLWFLTESGELQMCRVETGSTDGYNFEIKNPDQIYEGMQVITKQNNASSKSKTSSQNKTMHPRGFRI